MTELVVEPGRVVSRDEFRVECARHDIATIAFDGYVDAEPFDERVTTDSGRNVRVLNLDHHRGVTRRTYPSSCEQMMGALDSGRLDELRDESGELTVRTIINDGDHDASTSVNLALNPWLLTGEGGNRVRKQVKLEGWLDRTYGAFPMGASLGDLETNAWVFSAYNCAREQGEHMSKDPQVITDIVMGVGHRLKLLHMNRAEQAPLDMRYEVLDKGDGWTLIRDIGAQARMGATRDGLTAIISIRDQNPDRLDMNLFRISPDVPFDIPRLKPELNEAECERMKELGLIEPEVTELPPSQSWGGTDDILGSPRLTGTHLHPEEVCSIAGW